MKYATWDLYFPIEGSKEGFTPDSIAAANGKYLEGAFFKDNDTIVGYVDDNFDPSEFPNWNFQIITQAEALNLAKLNNSNSYLDSNGRILIPVNSTYEI